MLTGLRSSDNEQSQKVSRFALTRSMHSLASIHAIKSSRAVNRQQQLKCACSKCTMKKTYVNIRDGQRDSERHNFISCLSAGAEMKYKVIF